MVCLRLEMLVMFYLIECDIDKLILIFTRLQLQIVKNCIPIVPT